LLTISQLLKTEYSELSKNDRRRAFLFLVAHLEIFGETKGFGLLCTTFWRSPEDQAKAVAAGTSSVKEGYHQQWAAMDLLVLIDGEERWTCDPKNPADPYRILGERWEQMHPATAWGGRWRQPFDPYHFQFGGLRTAAAVAARGETWE